MTAPSHLGFTDYQQTYAKTRTRHQRFLKKMEATIPWEVFLALSSPSITSQPPTDVFLRSLGK